MNGQQWAYSAWRVLRPLRWLLWIAFFVYSAFIGAYRPNLITSLGHLPVVYDLIFYGLGNAAVFVGFLEMMMREKAGAPRPVTGRWMASKA